MNGHVFQLHAERTNKLQFEGTMEALRIYSSTTYKSDIELLNRLFTDLKEPSVNEPLGPKETVMKDKMGKVMLDENDEVITTISKFEETIYNERIKQWIRDEASLKATVRSLYNIAWGQCSKKDKITMMKEFLEVETTGNVTRLLKEVKIVMLQIDTNTSAYDALDEAINAYYKYK